MNHLPINLEGSGDWAKLGGSTGELHGPAISIQAVGAGAGAVELYGGTDDIPVERRVLLGSTDADGNLLISSTWGAHWVKSTSGAAVVHYATGPAAGPVATGEATVTTVSGAIQLGAMRAGARITLRPTTGGARLRVKNTPDDTGEVWPETGYATTEATTQLSCDCGIVTAETDGAAGSSCTVSYSKEA